MIGEVVTAITGPGALRDWAMDPMREVRAEVSFQLLRPVKISLAIRARVGVHVRLGLGDWISGQDGRD